MLSNKNMLSAIKKTKSFDGSEEVKQNSSNPPSLLIKKQTLLKGKNIPSVSKECSMDKAKDFKCIEYDDDYRDPKSWKDGGFPLDDPEVIQKFRNALKGLIS